MERNYHEINEAQAKRAHDLMSFRDYEQGSTTLEYKSMVDSCYDLAEKVAKKRPTEKERVENLAYKYSLQLATYFNEQSRIGCMCPSVMICGPANFPVKKKEKQNKAWERNHAYFQKTQAIIEKIQNIYTMKEIVKSDDENAITKLQEKLDKLQEKQEYMKKANAYYRKYKTMKGYDPDISNEKVTQLDKQIEASFSNKPYDTWQLTNNNANIKRIKERIANLEQIKAQENNVQENEICKIVENTEAMRLQLYFKEKPSEKVRQILKSNGFKFSPKNNNAWQRQLTANARYACKRVMEDIKKCIEE